jgi:diamine N-acetyltransferase
MRFEPSRDMKITLLPEQKDQLCARETIREIFAKDDKGECMAFDIYDAEAMVGFAMFCQYPEGTFFLWNYAIDAAYQHRGLGKQALRELLDYMVARCAVKEFTTTYVWGNDIARRLYETVGFVETDVVEEDDYKEVNMIYRIE